MSIEIERVPPDIATLGTEPCALCSTPTMFWRLPEDVAVCPSCASTRDVSELPSKDEWCARVREAAQAGGQDR